MFDRGNVALALLWFCPVLWSANYLVARWAAEWYPPHALALTRWLIALVPLLVVSRGGLWAQRKQVLKEWPDLLALGASGMWIAAAFLYIACRTTTATNSSFIFAATPVLIMLGGAAAFRERLSILQAVGAALALFGVLQIISKGNLEVLLGLQFTAGDLWVAVGTVAWAAITALFFGIDRANWT